MRILVVGNGGREHAICEALARSSHCPQIINFGTARNPGIANVAEEIIIGDIMDLDQIYKITQETQPDLAIIGPDDPIGAGAADEVRKAGVKCFAPSKAGAQLESSKAFTRNLLEKYGIAGNPEFYVSIEREDEKRRTFFDRFNGQIVVKADGLLGGKGVLVADEHFTTFEEADDFAQKSIEKFGRVVLEERFIGEEFSLISIVDGETVLDTPAIQDHKRAFEGDEGPNTGGMGCVSNEYHTLPFLTPQDLEQAHEITVQTMKALEQETGEKYVGVMYGGFIATKNGVKLIEYNARFGDPEVLNILPLLKTDFVEVCLAAVNHQLSSIVQLDFEPLATVVRYLCPEGYPTQSVKNVPIQTDYQFPSRIAQKGDAQAFFASVSQEEDQLILKGSRAIGILGKGKTLQEAYHHNQMLLEHFSGPLFYRQDIGTTTLMEKRIAHMKHIKSS